MLINPEQSEQIRLPINHDTTEYQSAIEYRDKVNTYYDSARNIK